MSSKKSKDKIQKSVEASILDAITKLKGDDNSLGIYERTHQANVDSVLLGDKSAQVLWDLAKDAPVAIPSDASLVLKELKEEKKPNKEEKTRPMTHTMTRREPPAVPLEAPPVTSPPVVEIDHKQVEKSELKTIALGAPDAVGKSQLSTSPPFSSLSAESVPSPNLNNFNLLQMKLYEGDHLKIAQKRIEDLEKNIDRLRIENERLASASELFQKRAEENLNLKQEVEKKLHFNEERFAEERISLKNHLEQRDEVIKELREKIENMESRLSADVRKSRSRERELENRLELARLEKLSLVGSKDEIILDLKRQVDQLNHELGGYRRKVAQMNQTLEANQDQFRRTVRALRLALTNLEVNDQVGGRVKKAE